MLSVYHVCVQSLSCVRLFGTPWTIPGQAPLSIGFFEYWSELPLHPPGDLPDPGTELTSPVSPGLAGRFFTTEPPEKPLYITEAQFNFIRANYFSRQAMFCQNLSPPPSRYSARLYYQHSLQCDMVMRLTFGLSTVSRRAIFYLWSWLSKPPLGCCTRSLFLAAPWMLFFPLSHHLGSHHKNWQWHLLKINKGNKFVFSLK